jgi:hypothetical protein
MRKETIEVPIYDCKLTIILDDDFSYIQKKYKIKKDLSNYGAVTLDKEAGFRNYVVSFTDKYHLSNIAHEIVHIKNAIYLDCAMKLDSENDEHEAYLTGWLFNQIYQFLEKK